jgi:hypothetical protein
MGRSLIYYLWITMLFGYLVGCSKEDDDNSIDREGQGPIQDGDYYVATWGNDTNSGTFESPWATWQKAFETAEAGDIVYFRGGVWYPQETAYGNNITMIAPKESQPKGHNGEPGNPICYFNYPGETPILDCKNVHTSGAYITGLTMYDAHWINWRGLTIRNVYQRIQDIEPKGIVGFPVSNMTFENMVVHDIGGCGYYLYCAVGMTGYDYGWGDGFIPYDTTRFINCDTYQCCDTFRVNPGQTPGNLADGFKYIADKGGYVSYEGCRAWHCSDDGFDIPSLGYVKINNCWSFLHSYPGYNYEGNGFKLAGGWSTPLINPYKVITNTLSVWCDIGIYLMSTEEYQPEYRVHNNTMYKNGIGLQIRESAFYDTLDMAFHNNIIYASTTTDAAGRPRIVESNNGYSESNNTWDYAIYGSLPRWLPTDTVTVTDEDFVSINESELILPRKADGSLPDINFLKLVASSDLINAGVDVGLPFLGSAPEIGAFEVE